ncbi:MAG: DUF262 domain-containing protein [Peptoanaerobacter stomatis]|uniref:DUF262 domain-containing protein n=1 Tax=Peptoanaerobacter stomatis TaxID=796937 RepID=UPI003FA1194B
MSDCRYETWSFRQLYEAIEHNNFSGKRLVIPIFQRGRCWDSKREHKFIESLEKGYPVGSMLFYETEDVKGKLYVLVDGLQRSNCIKKYLTNPMEFVDIDTFFTKDFIKEVSKFLNNKNLIGIKQDLNDFMIMQKSFDEIQYYEPTSVLIEKYGSINNNTNRVLCDMLKNYMSNVKIKYNSIKDSNIPIIVYTGDPKELSEIFDRINSQGVSLDVYELHAATYPQERTVYVKNPNVLKYVEKRYENFTKDGFKMAENNGLISETKTINPFEYLFGLGKYITEKYEILDIVDKKTKEDDSKINVIFHNK